MINGNTGIEDPLINGQIGKINNLDVVNNSINETYLKF